MERKEKYRLTLLDGKGLIKQHEFLLTKEEHQEMVDWTTDWDNCIQFRFGGKAYAYKGRFLIEEL